MANKYGAKSFQSTPPRDEFLFNTTALPREDYFRLGERDDVDINYPWFWQTIPSKEEVRLYSNLPLDIVRSIFDMAMWEHPKPVHLLLVSKEVKNWIEPLLYRHIQLPDRQRLGQLYRTYLGWKKRLGRHDHSAERGYLSLRTTKSIVFGVHPSSTIPMFDEMTALERVEFWYLDQPFILHSDRQLNKASSTTATSEAQEDTYRYKSIRHLSLNDAYLGYHSTFCHRAYRDITHLDMYFNERMEWETLRHLQSLTHLALDTIGHRALYNFQSEQALESWVSNIVTACPITVQVLIICCIGTLNANFDLLDFVRSGSEPGTTDGGGRTRIPSSVASNPKAYCQIPHHHLQFLSRLALGKVDPRVVVGSATGLHDDHTFRNGVVYITYNDPTRRLGHDVMRWYEAEQIIKRRLL